MLVALAALVCGLAHRQISAALSSLRVRTLVIPYRPPSLSQYYWHKRRRPARYALNAGVAHAECSSIFFLAITPIVNRHVVPSAYMPIPSPTISKASNAVFRMSVAVKIFWIFHKNCFFLSFFTSIFCRYPKLLLPLHSLYLTQH